MNEELEEEGKDEVEQIKQAMVREKAKADKFIEKQISKQKVESSQKIGVTSGGGASNPLQLNKNLDGFIK